MNNGAPVVLVHGAWHGSWCWSLVVEELATRGIASVAVDLDGHGLKSGSPASRWRRPFDADAYASEPSPVAFVTATDSAATLVRQVERIGHGEPCVLVAHSMGGVVTTLAAERSPALIGAVVYVSAFVPTRGRPAVEYAFSPENEGSLASAQFIGDPAMVGAVRLDTGDPSHRAALYNALYHDVPIATAEAAISLLGPDAPVGLAGEAVTVSTARFGSIPHTYVLCTDDNFVRPPLQRRMIREIDSIARASTDVVELKSSHSPFLSRPVEIADAIDKVWRSDT